MSVRRRVSPARLDLVLAVAIWLVAAIEILSSSIGGRHEAATMLAAALLAAPVAARRRSPGVALVWAATVPAVQQPLGGRLATTGGTGPMLALALLSYSSGAWLGSRAAALSLGLACAAFATFVAGFEAASAAIVPVLLVLVVPWLLGRTVRERARRTGAFRALALQTEREQAERERAAIAQEQLRIGVELQDIVAHSVSAMVIQASGARRLLRSDPGRARETILAVEQTGRQTLADLRRLLGMLRREEDSRSLAPQPGLEQLAALLTAAGERGMSCELRREDTAIELTPGVNLVGYRVVESALACAAAAGGTRARVEVGCDRDFLRVAVSSDASSPPADEGLQAISRRVALYGGRFELAAAGTDLAVRVTLPAGGARAAAA